MVNVTEHIDKGEKRKMHDPSTRKTNTIVFDLDGTLTDFNEFIKKNAYPYFEKKYHLLPQKEDGLEIEEIFDLDVENNEDMDKIKAFWIGPMFVKFSLFGKLRKGAKKTIHNLRKKGFEIEIHSSRASVCEKSMRGFISRLFTRLQLIIHGIGLFENPCVFYESDKEKIKGVKARNPILVFDDKPCLINEYSDSGIRTICISGTHNKEVLEGKYIKKISGFEKEELEKAFKSLFKRRDLRCIGNELESWKFWKKIRCVGKFIRWKSNPIILHSGNIVKNRDEGVVYAPNHRSTLDPLIIESVLDENIHWAALLRFFKGEDSIFNNNKNVILCKLTQYLFAKLHFFPIDRRSDNIHANNYESIREMDDFLRNNYLIGIFPEGTTKRDEGKDFGLFDDSFISLARKNDAWIQPVTSYWLNSKKTKHKLILNFGKPYKATNMSREEAYCVYIETQYKAMEENKKIAMAYTEELEG